MTSDDRRNHARFPFASRLEIRQRRGGRTLAGEDVQRVARAVAIDVSVGGLGFRSALPLAVGDLISVCLQELGDQPAGPEQSLAGDSRLAPRMGAGGPFEVVAIVRHVKRQGAEYAIGAERRAPA
jgi:hypothetical protein